MITTRYRGYSFRRWPGRRIVNRSFAASPAVALALLLSSVTVAYASAVVGPPVRSPAVPAPTFVTVTGTINWMQVDKDNGQVPGYSASYVQSGTFDIKATLTHSALGSWTSHSVASNYT